jgi:hypothetical protein
MELEDFHSQKIEEINFKNRFQGKISFFKSGVFGCPNNSGASSFRKPLAIYFS